MFYFDEYKGHRVLRSDLIKKANVFFTTRNFDKNILANYIHPNQTHSDNVEIVDNRVDYPQTDGLIVAKNDVGIYLKFADCTPLIFYDEINNIGAISHAGWRGTVEKIGVKTVIKMNKIFNSKPENIIALIGPAISICCYEVGEDVKNILLKTVKNNKDLFIDNKVDLKKINARQLEEIGIEKIDICPYCTSCNNDLFFSYRKENGTTNRHYAVLRLN